MHVENLGGGVPTSSVQLRAPSKTIHEQRAATNPNQTKLSARAHTQLFKCRVGARTVRKARPWQPGYAPSQRSWFVLPTVTLFPVLITLFIDGDVLLEEEDMFWGEVCFTFPEQLSWCGTVIGFLYGKSSNSK